MLQWRNTSNLLSCDFRSNQVSAPHRSRFIGMALKRRYLLYTSRWELHHTSCRAPMEAFSAAILVVMSSLLRRLYEMSKPRYQKVHVKLTKPSATWKVCVSSSQSYISCMHSVCPRLCSLSLSEELILHHPLGWYAVSDFGRMRMMSEECSLGMNMTYFLVC